jgi:hypothetical protein
VHDLDYKLCFGIPETSKKKFWMIQKSSLEKQNKSWLNLCIAGL